MEKHYFVRDCKGYIIGNRMGYQKFWAATRAQDHSLAAQIYETYESRHNKHDIRLSSISYLSYEEAEFLHNEAIELDCKNILQKIVNK